jgi:3'-phosphoadenosine 5'-phosphosulfate (PAPS) 3'-phosphatase
VCIQLAQASGKVIRHFEETGKNQSTMTVKPDRSRLTQADLLIQRTFTYNLKQIYGPSLSINGEEDTKECEILETVVIPDVIRRDGKLDMNLMKEKNYRRQASGITKSILDYLSKLAEDFDTCDASV